MAMATKEEEETWGERLKNGGYVIKMINVYNDDMMKAIYTLLEMTTNFPKQTQLAEFIEKQKDNVILRPQPPPKHRGEKRPHGDLPPESPIKKPSEESKFVVYSRDQQEQVTAVCFFFGEVPTTLANFWNSVLVNDGINRNINKSSAHVSVRLRDRWSKLDETPYSANDFFHDDNGVAFQIAPSVTPYTSPSSGVDPEKERTKVQFKDLIANLFPANPFAATIPTIYRDITLQVLQGFLQGSLAVQDNMADSDVLALVLAMPGSGKTRTVVEAARGQRYLRYKMSNHAFTGDSIREFLRDMVLKECGAEKLIPMNHKEVVVFHFDDIQGLMETPPGEVQSLVKTLSKEIDELVNPKGQSAPRSWLKFVLTGTNIFTRSAIKIGTDVKALPVSLNGAFPLHFVTTLAKDNRISVLLEGTDYLERCRHNRRFTQWFFASLWDGLLTEETISVEAAYSQAFSRLKEQMSNQYEKDETTVSQVACSVFAKIIEIPQDPLNDDVISLGECSVLEREYIAGGGLNVYGLDKVKTENQLNITIYRPTGVVLELLEAFLARAAAPKTGTTVMSFLRVNRVCNFGIKGHLFEWLIAYDISCARSEIDNVMRLQHIERTESCIGGAVMSNAKVYNKIIAGRDPSIWVVRDRHNPHDHRWVDVAYPIKVTKEVTEHYQEYKKGFAFMECKSGYGAPKQLKALKGLKRFRDKFFEDAAEFATSHPKIFFVAIFVSQHLQEQASPAHAPRNMKTIVLSVTTKECPWISNFLALDLTDEETNDSACENFREAEASLEGATPYEGSQPL